MLTIMTFGSQRKLRLIVSMKVCTQQEVYAREKLLGFRKYSNDNALPWTKTIGTMVFKPMVDPHRLRR
jgi:hypothetical protein